MKHGRLDVEGIIQFLQICFVSLNICVTFIFKYLCDFFKTILRLLPVFDIPVASCYVIRILGGTLCQITTTQEDLPHHPKQAHKARRCDSFTIEWLNNRTARLLGLLGQLGKPSTKNMSRSYGHFP